MAINKSSYVSDMLEDVSLSDGSEVKTVVIQEMIWPCMTEVRLFVSDGKVYSALYENEEKASSFVLVPNKQEVK